MNPSVPSGLCRLSLDVWLIRYPPPCDGPIGYLGTPAEGWLQALGNGIVALHSHQMAEPKVKDLAAAIARLKRQLGFEDRPNEWIRDAKANTKCPERPKAKTAPQT